MEPAPARTIRTLALVSGLLLLVPVAAPAPLVLDDDSLGDEAAAPALPVVRLDLVGAEVSAGDPPRLRVRVRPLTEAGGSPSELDPTEIELTEDGRALTADLGAEADGVVWLDAEVLRDGAEHEIGVRIGQGTARTRIAYPAPPGPSPAFWAGLGVALAVPLLGVVALLLRRRGGASISSLTVLSGPGSGQVFQIGSGTLRIGAIEGNDIVLDSPGVSRFHAEILRGPSGLEIRDLHSSNGTLVNGERVQVAALRAGDKIQVADVELFFGG